MESACSTWWNSTLEERERERKRRLNSRQFSIRNSFSRVCVCLIVCLVLFSFLFFYLRSLLFNDQGEPATSYRWTGLSVRGWSHQLVKTSSFDISAVIMWEVVGQHLFFFIIIPNNCTVGTGRKVWCDRSMRDNRLKSKTPRKTTNCNREICRIYLQIMKVVRQMSACQPSAVGNTRISATVYAPKISPDHCCFHKNKSA